MKKLFVLVMTVAMAAFSGAAMAAGTANLTVQATVVAGCGINSTTPVSFVIDPGSTVNATASGAANVWCATGVTGTVAISGTGLHGVGADMYMYSPTAVYSLRYTLDIPAATVVGAGRAAGMDVAINGTVIPGDFSSAPPAADYSDTVLVTINP